MLALPACLTALALAAVAAPAAPPRTFRVDYFHTGTASNEVFSLDRLVLEPLPFPGRPDRPLDELGLGKYLFEVREQQGDRLLYSRGFASIFGEWETTDEARGLARTFSESIRFPAPAVPVKVVLKKRGPDRLFREVWTLRVDPRDPFVDSASPASPGPLLALQRSGTPEQKFDLLLIGDGYTAAERGRFEADARRLMRRSSPPSHGGRGAPTSTSGGSARPATSPASHAPPPASTGAAASAPASTPSARSATCSASRTARCATSPPSPRTTPSASW